MRARDIFDPGLDLQDLGSLDAPFDRSSGLNFRCPSIPSNFTIAYGSPIMPSGGVRAPGGLHRLQSGWPWVSAAAGSIPVHLRHQYEVLSVVQPISCKSRAATRRVGWCPLWLGGERSQLDGGITSAHPARFSRDGATCNTHRVDFVRSQCREWNLDALTAFARSWSNGTIGAALERHPDDASSPTHCPVYVGLNQSSNALVFGSILR